MKRITIPARPNWQAKCEEVGFDWHTLAPEPGGDTVYWDETHAYEFTLAEIEKVEEASTVLYRMCLSAVEYVIDQNLLSKMAIPAKFHDVIKRSWQRQDIDLYGRFDFAFDADGTPKMLEFNADTPTSLLESSVVQWIWMEDYAQRSGQTLDQFNSIHEKLIEVLRYAGNEMVAPGNLFHFAAMAESREDFGTTEYIRDCAEQAGINTAFISMEDIGWNGSSFTDLDEKSITTLFKLYPWEHLIRDEYGSNLLKDVCDIVEPAWKMILSNKGILPILWEMYPNHKNLLPAYWQSAPLNGNYVEKPLLAREGADVKIIKNGLVAVEGEKHGYDSLAPSIYQEYLPLPKHDGMTPIIGSWIIGGEAAGIGIREDVSEVTGNCSHFIPHYFV